MRTCTVTRYVHRDRNVLNDKQLKACALHVESIPLYKFIQGTV